MPRYNYTFTKTITCTLSRTIAAKDEDEADTKANAMISEGKLPEVEVASKDWEIEEETDAQQD